MGLEKQYFLENLATFCDEEVPSCIMFFLEVPLQGVDPYSVNVAIDSFIDEGRLLLHREYKAVELDAERQILILQVMADASEFVRELADELKQKGSSIGVVQGIPKSIKKRCSRRIEDLHIEFAADEKEKRGVVGRNRTWSMD